MSSVCDNLRYAIDQGSAFRVSDAVSHRLGDKVQAKNPEQRRQGVSGNETSGGEEILSGLGIHCDWNSGRSRPYSYGDPAEVRGQQGGGDVKEEYESAPEPEVSFPLPSVLGPGRDLVERIFRLDGRNQRGRDQEVC